MGFEPTRLTPADLKSAPLDHSGNRTGILFINIKYDKSLSRLLKVYKNKNKFTSK